jgi:hypothetical protein
MKDLIIRVLKEELSKNKDVQLMLKNHIQKDNLLSKSEWDYIMDELECVVDNRGQWDHPGKCTMINSNMITMENVPYPLIGIDDTGHTKLMLPNNNYKFPGNMVFEIPLKGKYKDLGLKLLKFI